tara:strand:+ start:117 stop:548 length:432 start_codon:yes stop_codon:yes gene_type:complete
MKPVLSDLYQEELLAYADAVKRFSRLQNPTGTGTAVSRSCGSSVTVDLIVQKGFITDIGLEVDACALGSASSAIVAEKVAGKTLDEISNLGHSIWSMLRSGGSIPGGDWRNFKFLAPAKSLENRHQSICLIFDAIKKAGSTLK